MKNTKHTFKIEYLMKENEWKETILHLASKMSHAEIVELLLDAFGSEKNKELIEYLSKGNKFDQSTSLHLASYKKNEKLVSLLERLYSMRQFMEMKKQ